MSKIQKRKSKGRSQTKNKRKEPNGQLARYANYTHGTRYKYASILEKNINFTK